MVGSTSQKINVEKQKGEYAIFICWLFLPSVEQIRSFRGNLHAWEVCSLGESLEEIWMAGTRDKPRTYDSASVVGQISAIYPLCWEIVPSWTKNIKYNFRLLASHDIIRYYKHCGWESSEYPSRNNFHGTISKQSAQKVKSILSTKCYFSILMISDLFLVVSTWLLKISYCLKI